LSQGDRNILRTVKRGKANWIGHILSRSYLLKHVIHGKIQGRKEVTRGQGRRCKQALDDLMKKRAYWRLKEEALDRNLREPNLEENKGWKKRCYRL
jgi:hypothetical protein